MLSSLGGHDQPLSHVAIDNAQVTQPVVTTWHSKDVPLGPPIHVQGGKGVFQVNIDGGCSRTRPELQHSHCYSVLSHAADQHDMCAHLGQLRALGRTAVR